jgi:hypothetical protein
MDVNESKEATGTGLIFFSLPGLELISQDTLASDATASRHRIAAYLLGDRTTTVSWKELVAAALSSKPRLRRAQFLLRDLDQRPTKSMPFKDQEA